MSSFWVHLLTKIITRAGVMEAINKGPAFGDGKLLHAYVYSKKSKDT
jgi:hypothetical protein